MKALLKRFRSNKSGATSIEYAFIAAMIALAFIAAAELIGLDLANTFDNVATAF